MTEKHLNYHLINTRHSAILVANSVQILKNKAVAFFHSNTIFKYSLLKSAAWISFVIHLNFVFVLGKCLKAQIDFLVPMLGLHWSTADVWTAEGCRKKITTEGQITNQHVAKRSKFQNPFPIAFLRAHRKGSDLWGVMDL